MKKKVFSGIKPSGELTLGNYLGMLKPAMDAQEGKENIFCVVNYHAITVHQEPKELSRRTIDIAKMYLAAGLDLERSLLFVQSDLSEHTELGWILNCFTGFGEASRMVQFKDKHRVKGESVTVGLFDYPVLMAADILLHDTDEVPVGEDQKQHVELCRDIAERINNRFGPIFKVPSVVTKEEGARIMSLTNPAEKMSKSDEDPNGSIALLDSAAEIRKKFSRAVTDSGKEIVFDQKKKPGISNLLNILSVTTGTSIKELERTYQDKSYGEFKADVAEAVIEILAPFQERFHSYSETEVRKILTEGATKARRQAQAKLAEVKKALGIDY